MHMNKNTLQERWFKENRANFFPFQDLQGKLKFFHYLFVTIDLEAIIFTMQLKNIIFFAQTLIFLSQFIYNPIS